jgi:hypothetical protein
VLGLIALAAGVLAYSYFSQDIPSTRRGWIRR